MSGSPDACTICPRGARPKLRATLDILKPGDTSAIYKPDRIARSMKELLILLEDEPHARDIDLEVLTGICAAPAERADHRRQCCSWSPRWPWRWTRG
ncbi:recombinase family protein [Nonomuraea sp. NPDC049152]|uniref:recombinase family protein n=1 Tax=Nonomuraea sp. NPDC049152 TaxID=3154350 RepID=UPI0033C81CE9